MITTFRNPLTRSVFLDRCYPQDRRPLFELVPVEPDPSWPGTDWACVGTSPIEVRPGEIKIDTLTIEGPNGFSHTTGKVEGRIEGKFKIGLMLRECPEIRCAVVDSIRFSNTFDIRLAQGLASSAPSMAGCYMLGWVPGIEQTTMITPPRRFRLYSTSARVDETPSATMRVRPIIALGDSSNAYWLQSGSDSIFVTWSSAFSAYRLRLRPDGGLLFGSLEVFSLDHVIKDNITDAVARRVLCDRTFKFL